MSLNSLTNPSRKTPPVKKQNRRPDEGHDIPLTKDKIAVRNLGADRSSA